MVWQVGRLTNNQHAFVGLDWRVEVSPTCKRSLIKFQRVLRLYFTLVLLSELVE